MHRIDKTTEASIRRFMALIEPSFDLAGAIVYGSRARGSHHADSDADVAVLLRGAHERLLPITLRMADIAFDVLLETGINISPLPLWLDEWEHPETHANPALVHNIAVDGIRL